MCLADITDRKGSAVHTFVCYSPIYIFVIVYLDIQADIFAETSKVEMCYGSCPVCMLAKCVVLH